MSSYNKMAATKCRFRLDFVRLSIKICRFSSTLTGTASKYICCIVPLCKITNKRGIAIETGVAYVRFKAEFNFGNSVSQFNPISIPGLLKFKALDSLSVKSFETTEQACCASSNMLIWYFH